MTTSITRRLEEWHREERGHGVPAIHGSFFRGAASDRTPVLLLHGAGGTPADFGHLAGQLAAAGIPSLCPLLPAHGRGSAALANIRFDDMAQRSLEAYDVIEESGRDVAVIGQSVGAVLGIYVTLERPVVRFAALAPALRPFVLRRLFALPILALASPGAAAATWRWQRDVQRGIHTMSRRLSEIRCPLLVLHSKEDDSVSLRGARDLVERAGSSEKRLVVLEAQGHVLSVAPDLSSVLEPLKEFLA